MLGILLPICSIKKELHTTVFSLPEDAVPMELTAGTITKYLQLKIVNALIKLRIFLEDHVLVVLEKT